MVFAISLGMRSTVYVIHTHLNILLLFLGLQLADRIPILAEGIFLFKCITAFEPRV